MSQDRTIPAGAYVVHIYKDNPLRGYFERNGEAIGGLWFEQSSDGITELVDYDGVFALPADVVQALRSDGYWLEPSFDA